MKKLVNLYWFSESEDLENKISGTMEKIPLTGDVLQLNVLEFEKSRQIDLGTVLDVSGDDYEGVFLTDQGVFDYLVLGEKDDWEEKLENAINYVAKKLKKKMFRKKAKVFNSLFRRDC